MLCNIMVWVWFLRCLILRIFFLDMVCLAVINESRWCKVGAKGVKWSKEVLGEKN